MSFDKYKEYLTSSNAADSHSADIAVGRNKLKSSLLKLEGSVLPEDVPAMGEAIDGFEAFAPNVSLIGQVKAGKTALANALLDVSELFPSDVNPWTSVVTSIHVNRPNPKGKRAVFRFFDESDWEDMVSNSGRIVDLAKKANLESRVEELTEQIQSLKERTEGRLGRNFKMLLGNQHSFSHYDGDLIKRYVCLGEDEGEDEREGRFADLTKSADVYLDTESFGYPLTLADTPGVNDPFLVREAATLENLGQSHICVVVLSAHQALSSVDLGLMRVLKRLKSDRLIVFVNRVDELPEPDQQIREIYGSVTKVLKAQKLHGDIPIIFGSAAWADAAIVGHFDNLPEDSVDSLKSLIDARTAKLDAGATDLSNIDNLTDVSGVSALRAVISEKVWEQVYQPKIEAEANRARRFADRSLVYMTEAGKGAEFKPDLVGIKNALQDLADGKSKVADAIQSYHKSASEKIKMDMASSYYGFLQDEKRGLEACLSSKANIEDWAPDTEGLRSSLNEVYNAFTDEAVSYLTNISQQSAELVSAAYEMALGAKDALAVAPQTISEPPVPVSLMRTMSVDLRASNSIEWLKRKLNKSTYIKQFTDIANADLRSTVEEICKDNIDKFLAGVRSDLATFFDEHQRTINSLPKITAADIEEKLKDVDPANAELHGRMANLRDALATLQFLEGAGGAQQPDNAVTEAAVS